MASAVLPPDPAAGLSVPINRTRPESSESASKRSHAAASRAALYANPLPLVGCDHPDSALLYSALVTLSLSVRAVAAKLRASGEVGRNRVPKEAYLNERIVGYWDESTRSVWVLPARVQKAARSSQKGKSSQQQDLDKYAVDTFEGLTNWMHLLWTRGFFGKGSLSRSEPTWWQREKNRVTGEHVPTAEDITSARRAERKIYKAVKAKERADEKEKQAVAMMAKDAPGSSSTNTPLPGSPAIATPLELEDTTALASAVRPGKAAETTTEAAQKDASTTAKEDQQLEVGAVARSSAAKFPRKQKQIESATERQERKLAEMAETSSSAVPNLEHTQLQREEAFFLIFALGSLSLVQRNSAAHPSNILDAETPLSLAQVWSLFLFASLPPSIPKLPSVSTPSPNIRPDNPFILAYLVYHHYRSLGWVVRNGVKFCTDWVLYKGSDGTQNMRGGAGPVGGHAEFAIVVIPTYEDPADAPSAAALQKRRDWRWLNTVNRVCSGVKKTVIMTFVTIPPLSSLTPLEGGGYKELQDSGCLSLYSIKEVSIKRFIPTRMRD